MSERDTVTTAEDRERIRKHVLTMLSRLREYLKEKQAKENGSPRDQDPP